MNIDLHFHLSLYWLPIIAYFSVQVFYVLYIAAISVYRDWDELADWVRANAAFPVSVMLIYDFCQQMTLFTLAFWDLPQGTWRFWQWKEFTVTQRLARYRSEAWPPGWRKRVATAICTQALNPFDKRGHC